MHHFKLSVTWCAILSISMLVGCTQPKGVVEGEVTFKGKPVPGGNVMFISVGRKGKMTPQGSVELSRDGKFSMELPVGTIMVGIDNREFEPAPATLPAVAPGSNLPPEVLKSLSEGSKGSGRVSDRWVQYPEKYYLPERSGLEIKVSPGTQKVTLELTE